MLATMTGQEDFYMLYIAQADDRPDRRCPVKMVATNNYWLIYVILEQNI